MPQSTFIIGCGYVGTQLAQHLIARQQFVYALSHSPNNQQTLQKHGVQVSYGDLDQVDNLPLLLPQPDMLLYYFVPPPSQGQSDTRMAHFLSHLTTTPQRIVLISTTGVYGDCQGAWIDETQPINPLAARAKRRVDAEQRLQIWADERGIPLLILRVPGIYGAERLPLARLQKGTPVLAAAISPYSNRVHVADLVQACIAAGECGAAGIYNICDGNPTTMTDYFNQVADAYKLPRPPTLTHAEAQQQLSPEMLSYLAESKRIHNDKMRNELGVQVQYPTLTAGLQAIKTQQTTT